MGLGGRVGKVTGVVLGVHLLNGGMEGTLRWSGRGGIVGENFAEPLRTISVCASFILNRV